MPGFSTFRTRQTSSRWSSCCPNSRSCTGSRPSRPPCKRSFSVVRKQACDAYLPVKLDLDTQVLVGQKREHVDRSKIYIIWRDANLPSEPLHPKYNEFTLPVDRVEGFFISGATRAKPLMATPRTEAAACL